ncbi:MAG: efflux RND transporter permease subunit [Planctomycetota bacterium]
MARRSIASNLLMLLLVGGGIWTAINVQREVFPAYELDVVEITVGYPGAAPAEVEQGILLPIEESVRGIQGIKEIVSEAREGQGTVQIELVVGTDRMKAFQDIDQAVSRIRTFPDDIEQPEVALQSEQREVMEVGIYGDVDIWTLRKLAERLRDRLQSHPAITQVQLGNVPEYVTHVEIPQERLREYGLTLQQVADVIRRSSEDVPAGDVDATTGEILLRMKERKQWAEDFGKIEILASPDGGAVTLGELATRIHDGFEEAGFHSQFNQKPSVQVEIYRIGEQSPLDIAEAVHEVLESSKASLPPDVHFRIDNDSARDYRDRLSLLIDNAVMAALIVFVILALFLELRLAFWVMIGMTISFLGGLIFMPAMDVSLNMVSMFGFIVVLGIVVDDAIVVGENVHEFRQRGLSALDAAIVGTRQIAAPVTFSILTNIVAFLPLLFMPGTTGKFWWPLPAVVIAVLAVSLVEALFILPSHLGHTSRRAPNRLLGFIQRGQQAFSAGFQGFVNGVYRRIVTFCLRWRYATVTAMVATFLVVLSYATSAHMGMIMMPEVSADEIEAGVRLPVGSTPAQAARVAEAITAKTREMFERHQLDRVAEGIKTNVRRQTFIDVEIVMRPPDERDMTAEDIIELWRDQIGDIDGVDQIAFEAERGPGGARQDISVDVGSNDIEVLEKASRSLVEKLEGFTNTRDVGDNFNRGKAQLDFRLRPEGRRLGLTPEDVGQQLRDAFFGALASRQLRGTSEIEVRVKLPEAQRQDLYHLERFVLRTPSGAEVPLLDVVDIEEGQAFSSINRRDGRRVVTVSTDVEPKRAIGQVMKAIHESVLPSIRADHPDITWTFKGTQSEMRESTDALFGGLLMAIAVIYALLAIAFGSYAQPFIVLGAIPFGIVGAVIGHMMLGYDLSLVSMMGVIALSGVVVNDSLIMVDYANRLRREEGLSAFDAIRQAGVRRFRPIILTTATTFGGLTPIILETSLQAQYLIPMAISLGFGIVFATAIILLLVPCLYVVLEDLRRLLFKPQPADG